MLTITSNGVAFEDAALGSVEDGDLAQRILEQELGGLVINAHLEVTHHFDFDIVVGGSDQDFPSTVAWLVSVKSLGEGAGGEFQISQASQHEW